MIFPRGFLARIATIITKKAGLLCEVMDRNDGIKYISTEYTLVNICLLLKRQMESPASDILRDDLHNADAFIAGNRKSR